MGRRTHRCQGISRGSYRSSRRACRSDQGGGTNPRERYREDRLSGTQNTSGRPKVRRRTRAQRRQCVSGRHPDVQRPRAGKAHCVDLGYRNDTRDDLSRSAERANGIQVLRRIGMNRYSRARLHHSRHRGSRRHAERGAIDRRPSRMPRAKRTFARLVLQQSRRHAAGGDGRALGADLRRERETEAQGLDRLERLAGAAVAEARAGRARSE